MLSYHSNLLISSDISRDDESDDKTDLDPLIIGPVAGFVLLVVPVVICILIGIVYCWKHWHKQSKRKKTGHEMVLQGENKELASLTFSEHTEDQFSSLLSKYIYVGSISLLPV